MTGTTVLAHVGALGPHDLWVIVPMVLLSIVVMIVMARPKRPPLDDDEPHREAADRREAWPTEH